MNYSQMTSKSDHYVLPTTWRIEDDWESSLYLDEHPGKVVPGTILPEL